MGHSQSSPPTAAYEGAGSRSSQIALASIGETSILLTNGFIRELTGGGVGWQCGAVLLSYSMRPFRL